MTQPETRPWRPGPVGAAATIGSLLLAVIVLDHVETTRTADASDIHQRLDALTPGCRAIAVQRIRQRISAAGHPVDRKDLGIATDGLDDCKAIDDQMTALATP